MIDNFEERNAELIERMSADEELKQVTSDWLVRSSRYEYSYHFKWLGRPIIQFPQDIVAVQEIIWNVRPQLIIETGVARGGSIVFSASMLELIGGDGRVLGIDVDIRAHNRNAIEQHPMFRRISLIEGSSLDEKIVEQVFALAKDKRPVLVMLDSNHTHEHVLRELELYSPLVTRGGYLIVFDTVVEEMPDDFYPDRPWGRGNNPRTAVDEFLKHNDRFERDREIEDKLLITTARGGYLRCVKE